MSYTERRIEMGWEFDRCWVTLTAAGYCDAYGGDEYWRVRALWNADPQQDNPSDFIVRNANVVRRAIQTLLKEDDHA